MIVPFWFPALWVAYGAFLLAIIIAFFTEKYETRSPRRATKRGQE